MKRNITLIAILLLAAFLRFYNLMHDSPYFFNPDERNMTIAVTQFRLPNNPKQFINCLISELTPHRPSPTTNHQLITNNCNLNPRFFAYGQFPLYLAFASDQIIQTITRIPTFISPTTNHQLITNNYFSTSHSSAIFWLRFYSALSSILTVLFVYLITKQIIGNAQRAPELEIGNCAAIFAALSTAFTPGLIQAAHFGTTESLLTFFFAASIYFSIKLLENPYKNSLRKYLILNSKFIILNSLTIGLALGSKLTGLFFLFPPLLAIMISFLKAIKKPRRNWLTPISTYDVIHNIAGKLLYCCIVVLFLIIGSLIFSILSSPYNLIDIQGFKGSVFGYEADVATGRYQAFYTRQFTNTTPILFQMEKIFPYALGWPIFIFGSLGFLFMSGIVLSSIFLSILQRIKYLVSRIKDKITFNLNVGDARKGSQAKMYRSLGKPERQDPQIIILVVSFLFYFLPNAFLFAKWTRFMTPTFPFFAIFAGYFFYVILGIRQLAETPESSKDSGQARMTKLVYWVIGLLVFISLLPGVAFMSIYSHPDSRVIASEWIWKNIPDKSYILFETANVIDIPLAIPHLKIPERNYTMISFNFYDIDDNKELFNQLLYHLEKADYFFIPSRRVFINHLRLPQRYPLLTKYYQLLSSGKLGFEKVAEFSLYPSITIPLYPKSYTLTFPDEMAEETSTVFDHPVIRIYKKVKQLPKESYISLFSN